MKRINEMPHHRQSHVIYFNELETKTSKTLNHTKWHNALGNNYTERFELSRHSKHFQNVIHIHWMANAMKEKMNYDRISRMYIDYWHTWIEFLCFRTIGICMENVLTTEKKTRTFRMNIVRCQMQPWLMKLLEKKTRTCHESKSIRKSDGSVCISNERQKSFNREIRGKNRKKWPKYASKRTFNAFRWWVWTIKKPFELLRASILHFPCQITGVPFVA